MSQTSICSFVNIVNILNLECIDDDYSIKSYIKKPKKINQIKQIKRPRLLTFTHNQDIELFNITENEFEFRENKYMAILKSNIQKAIRRNLPKTAITTAIKLFQTKGGSLLLLRRLCIIIVEDKLKNVNQILDAYKLLTWIMATEYGPKNWRNWILGLIEKICRFEHMPMGHNHNINRWYNNEYSNYFVIRSFFGGMKGDMRLLQNVAKYINDTLEDKSIQIKIQPVAINQIIDDIHILKSAVDFHCMPNMLKNIQSKHEEFSLIEIKQAIWIYSSSIRYKIERPNENEIWNTIKNSVRNYQKFIIDNLE
jgi:hypothetical protein